MHSPENFLPPVSTHSPRFFPQFPVRFPILLLPVFLFSFHSPFTCPPFFRSLMFPCPIAISRLPSDSAAQLSSAQPDPPPYRPFSVCFDARVTLPASNACVCLLCTVIARPACLSLPPVPRASLCCCASSVSRVSSLFYESTVSVCELESELYSIPRPRLRECRS